MTINKIDVDENKVTLSFNRHEITVIRKVLSSMYNELTEEDRSLHLEIVRLEEHLRRIN